MIRAADGSIAEPSPSAHNLESCAALIAVAGIPIYLARKQLLHASAYGKAHCALEAT